MTQPAIQPDPKNARRHSNRNKARIRQSLEQTGAGRSILVDGDGIIRAGNGVYEQAQALGYKLKEVEAQPDELVAVVRPDLRGEQAIRAAMLDNLAADSSAFDYDAAVLQEIVNSDAVIAGIVKEEAKIADLLTKAAKKEEPQDPAELVDKAAELQAKWQVNRGDLWQIGPHRLMCGDSTNAGDVARLMGGEKARWMWTDPPYGVNYVGKTKDALTIENDGADDLPGLLRAAFATADGVLQDGTPIYVAHPAGALQIAFLTAFVGVGWKLHETIIWLKNSMVLSHSDYHYKHEPILYGWKGKNRPWYGGRDEVSVIAVDRPSRSAIHPTMKPVELIIACIKNSSAIGDAGYEPFTGSGSTLIAGEQLGRPVFGLELDPKYCAVSLERMANLGLECKRLSDG